MPQPLNATGTAPFLWHRRVLVLLLYFSTPAAKTPDAFVTVGLDIPVLHVDTLGIFLWELSLQLVGEVMKNAYAVLCGLRKQNVNTPQMHIDVPFR